MSAQASDAGLLRYSSLSTWTKGWPRWLAGRFGWVAGSLTWSLGCFPNRLLANIPDLSRGSADVFSDTIFNGHKRESGLVLALPAFSHPGSQHSRFAKAKTCLFGAIFCHDAPTFSNSFAHAYARTGRRHVYRPQPEPEQARPT
jgi:hypothetical protein